MTGTIRNPLLSIIIPAYNEADRLPISLRQIDSFVQAQTYSIEVIVVNNNSRDATGQIARDFAADHPYLSVLDEPRQGKGAAVQTGMLAGSGQYLMFCDADFSMPVEEINKFVPPALDGYAVAIASREIAGSKRVDEPAYRHFMGRVFNFMVKVLAIPNVQDTQCGFKAFRREVVQDVFRFQTIDGWGFDVEVLFIALQRGYRMIEVPITWTYQPQSRVNPIRDSIMMLLEVLKVRWNGLRGLYRKEVA
jgi:glycosyltransferase involved in cell wall biosynthesis